MTSTTDERPTIAERYAVAMESSNLRVKPTRCDTDLLMAAGVAKDRNGNSLALGTSLYRLRAEFDSVKATIHAGKALAPVDRLMVLSQLQTLSEVKRSLGAHAVVLATKTRFMKPDADALRVAGRCLDVWLDPLCSKCDGRGTTNEYGKPKVICKSCGGSGARKSHIGKDAQEQSFAQALLSSIDCMVSEVDTSMRASLANNA